MTDPDREKEQAVAHPAEEIIRMGEALVKIGRVLRRLPAERGAGGAPSGCLAQVGWPVTDPDRERLGACETWWNQMIGVARLDIERLAAFVREREEQARKPLTDAYWPVEHVARLIREAHAKQREEDRRLAQDAAAEWFEVAGRSAEYDSFSVALDRALLPLVKL